MWRKSTLQHFDLGAVISSLLKTPPLALPDSDSAGHIGCIDGRGRVVEIVGHPPSGKGFSVPTRLGGVRPGGEKLGPGSGHSGPLAHRGLPSLSPVFFHGSARRRSSGEGYCHELGLIPVSFSFLFLALPLRLSCSRSQSALTLIGMAPVSF